MNRENRDPSSVEKHLDEIHELEDRLMELRRRFLESSSSMLESFIDENDTVPFLTVQVKGRLFAIPVAIVEEVIEMVAVKPVVERRAGLLGVFDYHGRLTALYDLAAVAGLGGEAVSADNVVIICIIDERAVGFMVREATDVHMILRSDIQMSEAVLPGALREIGILKLLETTASVVDLWSTVLAGGAAEEFEQRQDPGDPEGGGFDRGEGSDRG